MPPSKGAPTIEWNKYHPEMRTTLNILYEDYTDIRGPDKVKIFNKVFASELAECGFNKGIPDADYDKVGAQYRDKRKEENGHLWAEATLSPTTAEGKAIVADLRKKVKDTAASLNISSLATLPTYSSADGVASVARRGIRVPVKPQTDDSGSEGASGDDGEEETYQGLGGGPPKVLEPRK